MTLRLRTLEVVRAGGTVTGLAGAASGQSRRDGLLVRVRDADGVCGQGEASPLPGYSPDTLDECAAQLARVDAAAIGRQDAGAICEWIARTLDEAGVTAPAARFGLETALLDWLGKRLGLSVAVLLGGANAAQRQVPLAALVSDPPSVRAAHARGIRTFKLKLSPATWSDDLRLARAIRDELGSGIALRFDPNGRLPPAQAVALLAELASLAPEFVEEPVPFADFLRLTQAPVPLAADESLARPDAWPALASVCRVLVLKPALLGGACRCLALARDATARGLALAVTHTFDGPVALAAAAELAAALPGQPLACGLDRHAGLAAWPRIPVPQLGAAEAGSAGQPGLGLAAIAL